jgi:ketosteroid isomerase-like protein
VTCSRRCGWRAVAVALLVAAVHLAGVAHAQSPRAPAATPAGDAREIRRLRAASNAAVARHDTAGIGAVLAPHAVVVSSNSAQSIGRAAMLSRFAEQFAARPDVTYRRTPGDVRVFPAWGMASEAGEWVGGWTDPDGRVTIGGRYFAKWRKIGGRWLIESETFVPERCEGAAYCRRVPD